ncbi:MAG: hypothetical protein K0V04_34505 [Deltaproteobacteria bacterium]|nr:hypothetical protein [Deltaproteobacteria bacterium]
MRHDDTRTSFTRPLALALTTTLLFASGCGDDDSGSQDASSSSSDSGTTEAPGSTGTPGSTSEGGSSGAQSSGETTAATTTATGTGDSTGNGTDSSGEQGLEIAGTWFEDFGDGSGVDHIIDDSGWDQLSDFGDGIFHIDSFDNAARTVIAQGDEANEFFPGLYSKFNWTWDGDDLYYCTAVFDAETAADAEASPDADDGDLGAGCGGFGWSLLSPAR